MTTTMIAAPAPEPGPAPSRAATLHPVPERSAVVKEQIEAVSIALRNEQLVFLGTLAAIILLAIYGALRSHGAHTNDTLEYGPHATIPMTLIALLLPFGVWRASDRARRAYDWTMPVAQSTHTIIRMLAGWLWLMIGVAIYLLVLVGVELMMVLIAGGSMAVTVPAWEWLVPFTSASIAYLLISIAVIGSEHPWRWIGGIIAAYLLLLLVFGAIVPELRELGRALQKVVDGYYGLTAAIFGNVQTRLPSVGINPPVRPELIGRDNASYWLGATLIWGVLSIVGVWLAARRHSTS